jgi:hypothetical protein
MLDLIEDVTVQLPPSKVWHFGESVSFIFLSSFLPWVLIVQMIV